MEWIINEKVEIVEKESITWYEVKWLGYRIEESSWVSENDLNCPDLLKLWQQLKAMRKFKTNASTKVKRNTLIEKFHLEIQEEDADSRKMFTKKITYR